MITILDVKAWDVVIAGGGIMGVSLARQLRKHGATVLIVDRSEPGREASHAAAGMLAYCDPMLPQILAPLATASASLYPEFAHEVEDESGMHVDLRTQGTIACFSEPLRDELVSYISAHACMHRIGPEEVAKLEPCLAHAGLAAFSTSESSVDPRALMSASVRAAKHRGIDFFSGAAATAVEVQNGRAVAVATAKSRYAAGAVVNCCGAWAGQVQPLRFPTRPIKGQMLCLVTAQHGLLRHVVRAPDVYIVPRSDGRLLVGSTLEDVGFDKRVDTDTIQRLHQAAANLVPHLAEARMLETWAGLRPGTPDTLPLLGASEVPNYFVAAGHYRDGILLAPITAHVMSQVVRGLKPDCDLSPFSPGRF